MLPNDGTLFFPIGGERVTGLPSNFDVCVNAAGRRHGAALVRTNIIIDGRATVVQY